MHCSGCWTFLGYWKCSSIVSDCVHRWNRTRRQPWKGESSHNWGIPANRQAPAQCSPPRRLGEGRHHRGVRSHLAVLHLLCQLRWLQGHAVPLWPGLLLHRGPQTLQPFGKGANRERRRLGDHPKDQRIPGSIPCAGGLQLQGGREPDPQPTDGVSRARGVRGRALAGRPVPGSRLWRGVGHHQ